MTHPKHKVPGAKRGRPRGHSQREAAMTLWDLRRPMSCEEIAIAVGTSHQTIRNIERAALAKIRAVACRRLELCA